MEILSLIELLGILCFIGYLVHEYSMKKIHIGVKAIVFISWLISLGFIFILPLDIYFVRRIKKQFFSLSLYNFSIPIFL